MRTFCITLPETPERQQAAREHFQQRGVKVEFLHGIHGEAFGLSTKHPYEVDHPGSGYIVSPKHVGLHLSHYMAWSICQQLPDERFLILEDDAEFCTGWKHRLERSIADAPADFDMLYVGSCNCAGASKYRVKGDVWCVHWPQCTQAYIVARKAIETLLATQRHCWAPIDLSLIFRSLPHLKVWTVLPRIVGQRRTAISP